MATSKIRFFFWCGRAMIALQQAWQNAACRKLWPRALKSPYVQYIWRMLNNEQQKSSRAQEAQLLP
jgi:hypothetical protein